MTLPDGRSVPRSLTTIIRYPAVGSPSRNDRLVAAPAKSAGPFPLIVFAHGFNITPTPYAPMLRAWVRAGFVVAAPIFPLTNAAAPRGPNEASDHGARRRKPRPRRRWAIGAHDHLGD